MMGRSDGVDMLSLLVWWSATASAGTWDPPRNAVSTLNDAISALNAQEFARAEQIARALTDAHPDCGICQYMLAQSLFGQNRRLDAVRLLTQLSEEHDEKPMVWSRLGHAHYALQNFEQARECARTALALDPDDKMDALQVLALVAMRTGDADEVLDALKQADRADPSPDYACLEAAVRSETDNLDGLDKLMKRCERSDDPTIVANARQAVAIAKGDDEALRQVAIDPSSLELSDRIDNAFEDEDFEAARQLLERALEEDPNNLFRRLNLGIALYRMGALTEARDEIAKVFRGKAWIQVKDGSYAGILTKRDERSWQASKARAARIYVQLHVELGDVAQARSDHDRLSQFVESGPDLAASGIIVLTAEGRLDDAWSTARTMVRRWPASAEVNDAVQRLINADPTKADEAVVGALSATSPVDLVELAMRAQRYDRCMALAAEHLPKAEGPARGKIAAIGVRCAVGAENAEQAEAWLPSADADELHDSTRYNLALLHYRAEAWDAVLRSLPSPQPAQAPDLNAAIVGLSFNALVELERLDEALARADDPRLTAEHRLHLGTRMLMADRSLDQAIELLERACPDVDGQNREVCERNLKIAKGRLP